MERCFLKPRQNFHNCICPYLLVVDNQKRFGQSLLIIFNDNQDKIYSSEMKKKNI